MGSFSWRPAAQCGGSGGSCVGSDCVAAQMPGSCCLPGDGTDFYCRESNMCAAMHSACFAPTRLAPALLSGLESR